MCALVGHNDTISWIALCGNGRIAGPSLGYLRRDRLGADLAVLDLVVDAIVALDEVSDTKTHIVRPLD